jgi:hypothetical protein
MSPASRNSLAATAGHGAVAEAGEETRRHAWRAATFVIGSAQTSSYSFSRVTVIVSSYRFFAGLKASHGPRSSLGLNA